MRRIFWKLFLLSFLSLFLNGTLFCQVSFLNLKTDNEKAKTLYYKALEMNRARRFDLSIEHLEEALKKDPLFEDAYVLLLRQLDILGLSQKISKTHEALIKNLPDREITSKSYLFFAEENFVKGNMAESENLTLRAIQYSGKDLATKTKALQIKQNIAFIKGESDKIPEKIQFEPLADNLNRFPLQYFPALTADENFLIFTARQGRHESFDENIYVSRKLNGEWLAPQGISPLINTRENEGTSSINADARVMMFTRCGSPEGQGSCDIFFTERVGNNWTPPKALKEVNSPNWDSHPSLSADGRRLFFTSTRPGGQGRMDIWCATRDSNNIWHPPVNLGPTINTPYDEETPFIHANGQTLYFASDGHPGFGKADLFYAKAKKDSWEKPINLGKAINTWKDESGLFITASGKTGLFCVEERENRELHASQIQQFKIPDSFQNGPACNFLFGTITDASTKQRLSATVEIVELETGKTIFSMDSDKDFGTYTAVISSGKNFAMYVSKPGYLFKSLTVSTDSNETNGIKRDFELESLKSGASIVLNNIFFESGKAELLPTSIAELRKIGKLMRTNSSIKIEIAGHTDNVGNDASNLLLSQKRAKAVTDHLQKQGIEMSRLKSQGHGEAKPLNDNDSDENRAKNRRIEFKIL
jgi:outer membrane protein OmpA-like peptidoglycan-associated protein